MGSITYNYTGGVQTFNWSANGSPTTVTIDVQGAGGHAGALTGGGAAGLGARVQATLTGISGNLDVYVGGQGGAPTAGFNGGAVGGSGDTFSSSYFPPAGAGGGASDIRPSGGGLATRLAAAGGGGGGGTSNGGVGNGGAAGNGGQNGANASNGSGTGASAVPQGGSQTAGGAGSNPGNDPAGNGALGLGGPGKTGGGCSGGGGGGGYYGGGGGTSGGTGGGAGGAGGSSLVPSGGSFTNGFKAGNGQVTISWVSAAQAPPLPKPVAAVTRPQPPRGRAAGRAGFRTVTLINSLEGGTNGTTISTANSGGVSGNAFDAVSIGAGCTVEFSNTVAAAHGSLSAQIVTPGTAANAIVEWTTSLTGTLLQQAWLRAYIYISAYGGSQLRVMRWLQGGTFLGCIAIGSSGGGGKILTLDSGGTTRTTSVTSAPLNTWFRLEGYLIGSTVSGQIQVKIFASRPDAVEPDEVNTTAATINTGGLISRVDFGNPSSVASYTMYVDDLGASSVGYIGPAAPTAIPLLHPVGAVTRPLPRVGRLYRNPGVPGQTGPPFYALNRPSSATIRPLPRRGRAAQTPPFVPPVVITGTGYPYEAKIGLPRWSTATASPEWSGALKHADLWYAELLTTA